MKNILKITLLAIASICTVGLQAVYYGPEYAPGTGYFSLDNRNDANFNDTTNTTKPFSQYNKTPTPVDLSGHNQLPNVSSVNQSPMDNNFAIKQVGGINDSSRARALPPLPKPVPNP